MERNVWDTGARMRGLRKAKVIVFNLIFFFPFTNWKI